MEESARLVAGIQARDPVVLEEVARQCVPGLLRAARAAGVTGPRAEDLVQETFLVFLRRAEVFDGRARVTTWLFGILSRKLHEVQRELVRDARLEEIDQVMDQRFDADGRWVRPPRSPAAELGRAEVREALSQCLADLPDRERLAFHLREVEGHSTDEICKILDITPNHLGVVLYRGRNRLRECLEALGIRASDDANLS